MDEISPENHNKIIELLQKNNELLGRIYDLGLYQQKREKRREYLHLFIQLVPFLLLAIALFWVYTMVMGAVNALNHEVTGIKGNFDQVLGIMKQQYDFLTSGIQSIQNTLKSVVPDFSGVKDSFKSLTNGIGL